MLVYPIFYCRFKLFPPKKGYFMSRIVIDTLKSVLIGEPNYDRTILSEMGSLSGITVDGRSL